MQVIIFGNGFIGRQLALEAKFNGDNVEIIARSEKPEDSFLRHSGIPVSYFSSPSDFITQYKFASENQIVFILAVGIASPFVFENGISLDQRENLIGFFTLISEKLSTYPNIRVGYISSGGTVYGDSKNKHNEFDQCIPQTAYGRFHLEIESLMSNYFAERFIVFRLANPYGQEQVNHQQQGLIAYAYNQISSDKPVQLFGNGTQIRDYIDVQDAARVIYSAFELNQMPKILNIGTGVGKSNLEVVKLVAEVLNAELIVNLVPKRVFDIDCNILNTNLIESLGIHLPKPISKETLSYLVGTNGYNS